MSKRKPQLQQKEEDKREVFDMLKYDRKYSVAFDATIDDQLEHRYYDAVSRLGAVMTEGGTILREKGVTFRDNEHPISKFRVIGSFDGVDVSTTFIVRKGSIYFEGYSSDDKDTDDVKQPTWNILSRIELQNCRKPLRSTLAISYEKLDDPGNIGPLVLLESLYTLKNSRKQHAKQKAFYCACIHFAEAVRFTYIREAIAAAMRDPYTRHVLEPKVESLIVNWNRLSTIFRRRKLDVPQDPNIWDSDQRLMSALLELDADVTFDDNHEREVLNRINIFLFEAEDTREARREIVRKAALHQTALIPHPSVPLEKLKRTSKWITHAKSMKRQTLQEERDKLFKELISLGGDKDIWSCLIRALWKEVKEIAAEGGRPIVRWEEQDVRIGRLILKNTDINFRERTTDLSYCFDDKGHEYKLPKKLLSDPKCNIIE